MKLKKKSVYYIIGLLIVAVTCIPVMPNALKWLIALVPILFFSADITMQCLEEFYKKNLINKYLTAIIVTLGLIATGKLPLAAIAIILFSAANYLFGRTLDKATTRIKEAAEISAPYANAYANGRVTRISVKEIAIGQTLVLNAGDIVPCDCSVLSGEALMDYTNIFGSNTVRTAKAGSNCFSGGIVQSGKLAVKAVKTAKDSLATLIRYRTDKALAPSPSQRKTLTLAKLFERVVYLAALIYFIVLLIITKDFTLAVNQASVILVISAAAGLTDTLSALNLNAITSGRRRGVIFTDTKAVEQAGKLRTLSPNEPLNPDIRAKIEETNVVLAKGGYKDQDAVVYRSSAKLEADPNPSFKLALGFFSKKAQATVLDSNPAHIPGAIRTGQHHRAVSRQNLIWVVAEKLSVIALLFILNISPAAAVAIEFVAWMICLMNATKDI
ncbi:MAG: hypothetical protein IKU19_02515 [Clostridia bacterium]|nr:hypothetical protein [Clostridia bacterium]